MVKKIGISFGDPTGISGEILVKGHSKFPKNVAYIIYGNSKVIEKSKELTKINFSYQIIKSFEDIKSPGFFYLISMTLSLSLENLLFCLVEQVLSI